MQGDLNEPPIVIRSSQAKSLLMLLLMAGCSFGMFLTWREASVTPSTWFLAPAIAIFIFGILLFGRQVIWPDRLSLSPIGLEWRGAGRTLTYRWAQLSEFRVLPVRGAGLIGFSVMDSGRRPTLLARLNTALTGSSNAMPGLWEIEPARLAQVLNAARAQWGADLPDAESPKSAP